MSTQTIMRIAWKEYRTLRAFWLVGAIGTLALQILLATARSGSWNWLFGSFAYTYAPADTVLFFAVIAAGFFAFGAGALSFAPEREYGTSDLLLQWSFRSWELVWGKLISALTAAVALYVLLFASALLVDPAVPLVSFPPKRSDYVEALMTFLVYLPCVGSIMFLAGVLGSLVVHRTIHALWVGGLFLCIMLLTPALILQSIYGGSQVRDFFPVYLAVAVIAFVVAVFLARRWVLRSGAMSWTTWEWSWPDFKRSSKFIWPAEQVPQRPLRHLLWKELRVRRSHLFFSLGIPFVGIAIMQTHRQLPYNTLGLAIALCGVVAGVVTFHPDQMGQTDFLGERGVSSTRIWLSKQLAGLLAFGLLVLVVGATLFTFAINGLSPATVGDWPRIVVIGFFGYAAGQYLSLVSPSLILGFTWTAIATYIATIGLKLLVQSEMATSYAAIGQKVFTQVDVPFQLGVYAIVLAFLLITLLETSHWLAGRKPRIRWHLISLSLIVFATFVTIEVFRIAQIPSVTIPPFKPFVITEEARQTALSIESLANQIKAADPQWALWPNEGTPNAENGWQFADDQERELVDRFSDVVNSIVEISKRPACAFGDPNTAKIFDLLPFADSGPHLCMLILLSARKLESEGKLDEALDRYLTVLRLANQSADNGGIVLNAIAGSWRKTAARWLLGWAAHPNQTQQTILQTSSKVQEIVARSPTFSRAVEVDYLMWEHSIREEWSTLLSYQFGGYSPAPAPFELAANLLVLEKYRSLRLIRQKLHAQLPAVQELEHCLANWRCAPDHRHSVPPEIENWRNTTLGLKFFSLTPTHWMMQEATVFRMLYISLAAYAWRAEHHSFPESLDLLVGSILPEMPVDPNTGLEFQYQPHGFPNDLDFGEKESPIIAETPLLWSPGGQGIRVLPQLDTKAQRIQYALINRAGNGLDAETAAEARFYFFALPK